MVQGSIYKWMFVTSLFIFPVHGSAPTCCKQEYYYRIKGGSCSDGSDATIKCTAGYFGIQVTSSFSPEFDVANKFHIHDENNVSWLVLENDDTASPNKTSPDRYCLNKISNEKPNVQIALICLDEEDLIGQHPPWREIVFGTLNIISSFFLALSLFIYIILPEMRDVQDKALISMMTAFMVAFFCNGSLQFGITTSENFSCVVVAFTMYYAYLSAFFWLNIISLNIWKSVWFPNFNIQNELLYKIYCMIGWGLPLCFLAMVIIAHHIPNHRFRPGFEVSCWFQEPWITWIYFYGPILVLLLLNLFYLSLTSAKLWYKFKGTNCSRLRVLRFKCLICVRLAAIMGCTWIFEVISFAFYEVNYLYWILPDVLNLLQGFFIFVLLIVLPKRVRKLLAKRRPLNIPFPKSWATYLDEENYGPVTPEEVELSQS